MNYTLPELKQRLLAFGVQETDLPLIIEDVQKMILAKIFVQISARLTPELEVTLTGMSAEELRAYALAHPEVLPGLTETAIQEVTAQTWESYFTAVEQPSA